MFLLVCDRNALISLPHSPSQTRLPRLLPSLGYDLPHDCTALRAIDTSDSLANALGILHSYIAALPAPRDIPHGASRASGHLEIMSIRVRACIIMGRGVKMARSHRGQADTVPTHNLGFLKRGIQHSADCQEVLAFTTETRPTLHSHHSSATSSGMLRAGTKTPPLLVYYGPQTARVRDEV